MISLKNKFKNFDNYPTFDDLALWVQGADRPLLVVIKRGDSRYREKSVVILLEP